MRVQPIVTVFAMALLMSSCYKADPEFHIEVNQEYFINSWIHENAECPLGMTYVPYDESYLTLYRLRNYLDLHADGSASYAIGSPKDPHLNDMVTSVSGHWTYDPETNILMIHNSGEEIVFAFKVKSLTDDRLVMSYTTVPADIETK